jgi:predicted Zn-dependent protease
MEGKVNSFFKSLRSLLFLVIVVFGVYVYDTSYRKGPCDVPLQYSVGAFDLGFGLTEPEFQEAANQASLMWEKEYGKKLFEFSPTGKMGINLRYDDRQKLTQKNAVLRGDIEATRGQAESVKLEFSSLQLRYRTSQTEYENAVLLFQQHQADYNMTVSYWNGRGGAPKKEFEKLNQQKSSLVQENSALEQKRFEVNTLGDQINALIKKYNLLAGEINLNADEINSTAGEVFSAGEYVVDSLGKQEINIYQFENKEMLKHVLAHELGHALGLDHNPSKDSIMYAYNQSLSQAIDQGDLSALQKACTKKPLQIFGRELSF